MTINEAPPSAESAAADLADDEIVARATALRELIRSQQDEAEELGHYTEEVHQALLGAGLYHLTTPRKFGGLERSIRTFMRTVVEIARADPGSGWCYSLGAAHGLNVAAMWPESAHERVFTNPRGYFRSSQSLNPAGLARKVDGGYLVSGRSPYSSGCAFATHAIVALGLEGADAAGSASILLQALIPREDFTIADDWGGDKVLGMRASGSNTILFENVFLPDDMVVPTTFIGQLPPERTGAAIYGNPMYLGVPISFLNLELGALALGTAWAMLDGFVESATTKRSALPPFGLRSTDPQIQRDAGEALMKIHVAESTLLRAADLLAEWSEAACRDGVPFTPAMDTQLYGMEILAGRLASKAAELLFRDSGTSVSRKGHPMGRYLRDIMMYQTHGAIQYGHWAQVLGAMHLGMIDSPFAL